MTTSKARLLRIVRLEEARPDLPSRTLFHAGPPYRGERPRAVMNAAAQAAVIAGWASEIEAARRLLESGDIALNPAQDHGLAVPLAMVAAPAMWCFEVGDERSIFHVPMSEGTPPALRFGSDAPEALELARTWCRQAAELLNPRLKYVPALEDLIEAALNRGDDCHAMTAAGNQLFVDALGTIPDDLRSSLLGNAGFVLGIWMAWAGWKLKRSGSLIEAVGGNGIDFGWRPRGVQSWRTAPAATPSGAIFKQDRAAFSLGAIGDSALVDICGLGGQSLRFAPTLLAEWQHVLPDDVRTRHTRIIDPETGIVDVARVAKSGIGPIVNLAIVDRDGGGFPIGRGAYLAPPELFATGG